MAFCYSRNFLSRSSIMRSIRCWRTPSEVVPAGGVAAGGVPAAGTAGADGTLAWPHTATGKATHPRIETHNAQRDMVGPRENQAWQICRLLVSVHRAEVHNSSNMTNQQVQGTAITCKMPECRPMAADDVAGGCFPNSRNSCGKRRFQRCSRRVPPRRLRQGLVS
jgi:hypothetical protein